MLPYCRLHHVHHSVTQINQHPLARAFAFGAVNMAACRLDLFAHTIGQCAALAVGVTGGDDDSVEHRRHFFHIEHHDVAAFHIFECANGDAGEFVEFGH